MELSELTVRKFANLLGSDAPAPGGGSAAALAGSLGAALSAILRHGQCPDSRSQEVC